MDKQLEALTGAGGTVVLGGQTLTVRQLTLGDLSNISAYVRERLPKPLVDYMKEMRELQELKELDPATYQSISDELLKKAWKRKAEMESAGSPEATAVSSTPEAIAYTLWLSCRRDHPDLTPEKIKAMLDDESIENIKAKLDIVNTAWLPRQVKVEGKDNPLA